MDAQTIYRRRWWTLAVLNLSLLVIGLDNTILNVAIPTLQRELGATNAELQWIIDSYVLVFAGLLLAAGALGDRYGRKRALQAGLAVFGIASIASALSTTPNQLIAARSLMGVGGAFIMPATLSILTNVFPTEERARAIGIWAGVAGLGIGLGPIAGGWLLEHFAWGSVFLVNVPLVLLAIGAGVVLVPESRDPHAPPVDWGGALLSIAGLSLLVWAIIQAPVYGLADARTWAAIAVSIGLLAAFALWEARARYPMLELRFFESPRFTWACLSVTLVFFALFGSLFGITQLMQFVFGYSALEAGTRLAPIALAIMAGAILSSRGTELLGGKVMVALGLTVVASGLLYLGLEGGDGYTQVLTAMVVLGAGMGLAMTPATDAIMGSLPLAKAGVGSAMNDTTRQVGGALGIAILGSVLSSAYTRGIDEATAGLPPEAAEAASDSVGAALAVAAQLGGPAGDALAAAARGAFIDAMSTATIIAAGIAFLGALLALAFLPARETRTQAEIDAAFEHDREEELAEAAVVA